MTTPAIPRSVLATLCAFATLSPAAATAADAFDPILRYPESQHQVFSGLAGETIDLFSGDLLINQVEFSLPGKAGLDLVIRRWYRSRLRADASNSASLTPDLETSPLGYGWSLHMGRLSNPTGAGSGTNPCVSDIPLLELPDGSTRSFYYTSTDPATGIRSYSSRDQWLLQSTCPLSGGSGTGVCIWSTRGLRYEFSATNGYSTASGTTVWPATSVVDRFRNAISVNYVAGSTGAINTVTDTYGRLVTFAYSSGTDGLRLTSITAGAATYTYGYTPYSTPNGTRRLLTSATPPAGPGFSYTYATSISGTANTLALSAVTYPAGGTITYSYSLVPFYVTGGSTTLAAVTSRSLADRDGSSLGLWSFAYGAPQSGMNVTTITIPDRPLESESVTMFGYGAVGAGTLWELGLPQQRSRGSGTDVTTFAWQAGPAVASVPYGTSAYSTSCTSTSVPYDTSVYAPFAASRVVVRDGATYSAAYSNYDNWGQPLTVTETGQATRVTTRAYLSAEYDGSNRIHLVVGLPTSEHVCVGADCFDNSYSYGGAHYAQDRATRTGIATTFTYDAFGNVASTSTATGVTQNFGGYVAGNGTPTSLDFGGVLKTTRTTSWEGRIVTETQPNGQAWTYGYDTAGRIVSVTPPGQNAATSYSYAPDGTSMTMTRGAYWRDNYYNGFGRNTGSFDSFNVNTATWIDGADHVLFKSYPFYTGATEAGDYFDYDGLGRVIAQTKGWQPRTSTCDAPGACYVSTSYSNNCTSTTAERAQNDTLTTTRCYQSFSDPSEQRLVQMTDSSGASWQYANSAYGNQTQVVAPLPSGNVARAYDPVTQLLTSETTGPTGSTSYTWNAAGQMATRTDARGITAAYSYSDPAGRLTSIKYGSGSPEDVTATYDSGGHLSSMTSSNGGSYSFAYDELNRATSQIWTFGGHTYTTSYVFDATGCLASMTYPTGAIVTAACDPLQRPTSLTAAGNAIVSSATYDPGGRLLGAGYGNNTSLTRSYDVRGRLIGIQSPPAFASIAYAYDGLDNVVGITETTAATPQSTTGETRAYDRLNRLISDIAPGAWGTAAYDFDALGNRTFNSTGSSTFTSTFDTGSGLLSSTTGPSVLEPNMSYAWSPAGRLASSSDQSTYQYDAWDRRVQKAVAGSSTTVYHYDLGGRLIAETMSDGTPLGNYYYLGGTLAAVQGCISNAPPNCTERNWYHLDAFGNVIARSDAAGSLVAQIAYDPWGAVWSSSGVPGERQQRGAAIDSGTGLSMQGVRMYSRARGQFLDGLASRTPYPRALLTTRAGSVRVARPVSRSRRDAGIPPSPGPGPAPASWSWIPAIGAHVGFMGYGWSMPGGSRAPDTYTYGEIASAQATAQWGNAGDVTVNFDLGAPVFFPLSVSVSGNWSGQATGVAISFGPGIAAVPVTVTIPLPNGTFATATSAGTVTYWEGTPGPNVSNVTSDTPVNVVWTKDGPVVTDASSGSSNSGPASSASLPEYPWLDPYCLGGGTTPIPALMLPK